MILRSRLRLAARNTLRRRARTLFTMGMVAVSVALLLIALSWIGGAIGSVLQLGAALGGDVRVVSKAFAAREELMPLYENLADAEALAERVRKVPGVVAAEPRIVTGVTVTAGEEIGDAFALVTGASESYFRERLGAHERVVAGTWFTGAEGELVAGARVVKQAGAKVGDELVLVGQTQDGSLSSLRGRLVGVVRGGSSQLEQQILLPLERAQYLVDMPGGAVELLVYGADYEDAGLLAATLRAQPELSELSVSAWSEREPWRSAQAQVKGVQNAIVFVFVFLTALGIWNTMMMSVLERTHEIGVMRAMGMTRPGVVGLFVGEALAVSVVGGVLGALLGAGPAWLLEREGLRFGEQTTGSIGMPVAEVMRADLNWEGVLVSVALGLLMALLGSLLPALRAASIQPVAAMRAGR